MQAENRPRETTNGHANGSTPTPIGDSPVLAQFGAKRTIYEIGHRLQALAREEGPRVVPLPSPSRDDFGVPLRYSKASLTEDKGTEACAVAREYLLAPKGRCLLMIGGVGVGKTHAAVAALLAWPKQSKRFFAFPSLCGELLGESRVDALRRAKEVGFAIFDDLGMEYRKDGGLIESFVDEIVWHREANLKPTVITTNLSWEEIAARYSPRIGSRLGGAWVVRRVVGGVNLRS